MAGTSNSARSSTRTPRSTATSVPRRTAARAMSLTAWARSAFFAPWARSRGTGRTVWPSGVLTTSDGARGVRRVWRRGSSAGPPAVAELFIEVQGRFSGCASRELQPHDRAPIRLFMSGRVTSSTATPCPIAASSPKCHPGRLPDSDTGAAAWRHSNRQVLHFLHGFIMWLDITTPRVLAATVAVLTLAASGAGAQSHDQPRSATPLVGPTDAVYYDVD